MHVYFFFFVVEIEERMSKNKKIANIYFKSDLFLTL